jgi:hypothetical protein
VAVGDPVAVEVADPEVVDEDAEVEELPAPDRPPGWSEVEHAAVVRATAAAPSTARRVGAGVRPGEGSGRTGSASLFTAGMVAGQVGKSIKTRLHAGPRPSLRFRGE